MLTRFAVFAAMAVGIGACATTTEKSTVTIDGKPYTLITETTPSSFQGYSERLTLIVGDRSFSCIGSLTDCLRRAQKELDAIRLEETKRKTPETSTGDDPELPNYDDQFGA